MVVTVAAEDNSMTTATTCTARQERPCLYMGMLLCVVVGFVIVYALVLISETVQLGS
jgi:hypothetical protein